MKLTKKITAAIAALTMATTAFASTAMSASAITVTGNGGDGGFWSYYDITPNDGIDNPVWAPAPGDMYDGLIYSATQNGSNVDLVLQSITVGTMKGYVSAIDGTPLDDYTYGENVQYDSNGLAMKTATVTPDEEITITITIVLPNGTEHPGGQHVEAKFVITAN